MSEVGKKFNLGIDATPMLARPRTGVENYAVALVESIADQYRSLLDIKVTVYLHAGNPFASQAAAAYTVDMLCASGIPYRVHAQRRGYGAALSVFSARDRLQFLHMLRSARPSIPTCPYLITVYGIHSVHVDANGNLTQYLKLTPAEKKAILQAKALIAISESTKRELQTVLGPKLAVPIAVTRLGFDPRYLDGSDQSESVKQKYSLGSYIFFAGTLEHHKNVPRLVDAFARLKREHALPHKLVLAGRDGAGAQQVRDKIHQCQMSDEVILLGYVPDEDLPGLYGGADVYAFPSLHEGFGIPILEALASGTVVVTSPVFAIPEVAGDAVVYANPEDVRDIADGLWRAITDMELRHNLLLNGAKRTREFTWAKMTSSTLDFYRQLLESPGQCRANEHP